jgi:MFS family permease
VLLPVYLTALGLGPLEVGIVATLALFGSALTTLAVGFLGVRADQRRLLIAGSGLMVVTGLAFAASQHLCSRVVGGIDWHHQSLGG